MRVPREDPAHGHVQYHWQSASSEADDRARELMLAPQARHSRGIDAIDDITVDRVTPKLRGLQ